MARFVLRGNSFELKQADVLKALEGHTPGPIKMYWIAIKNKKFPIKQAVSVTTGVSVAEFTAHDAYRILKKLGITIETSSTRQTFFKKETPAMEMSKWLEIWRTLRENLKQQPTCPEHPDCTYVETLSQRVPNDLLAVEESGIRVRSHRTSNEDFIEENRFKVWWSHLLKNGSASLYPGASNNPHPWRSRLVGAIIATGLPLQIKVVSSDIIELR